MSRRHQRPLYYNKNMFTGLISGPVFGEEGQRRMVQRLFRATRWNQYTANWPVVLDALIRLWKMGKVSELKSPFYEPIEQPVVK